MEHYSLFRKDKCTAGEREGGKPPLVIGSSPSKTTEKLIYQFYQAF